MVKNGSILPSSLKPFQFFNFMLELDNFHEVVRNAWNVHVTRDPLQILARKLKELKRALCILNNTNGNLSSLVVKARMALQETQIAISRAPADLSLLQRQRILSNDLWKALLNEEKLSKQKSRIQRLKDGDKNTGFFHNQVKNRWN